MPKNPKDLTEREIVLLQAHTLRVLGMKAGALQNLILAYATTPDDPFVVAARRELAKVESDLETCCQLRARTED